MDDLDPLQGLLELHSGLGEIGLHGESSPPKYVLELHLLLIPKDEPNLSRVARVGPHQVMVAPGSLEGSAADWTTASSCDG